MATACNPTVRVECSACSWCGQRVQRDPFDPNKTDDVSGFGPCPRCGSRIRRRSVRLDRKAERARAELHALAQGARP